MILVATPKTQDKRAEPQQVDKPMKSSEDVFALVEKKFPGKFELLKLGGIKKNARCRSCNNLIGMVPDRGSSLFNVEEHVKSCQSARKRKAGNQLSLESFLKPAEKKSKSS